MLLHRVRLAAVVAACITLALLTAAPQSSTGAWPAPAQATLDRFDTLDLQSKLEIAGAFQEAYEASLKPALRAAMRVTPESERAIVLRELAAAGELVDEPLMVGRWSAFWTMLARHRGGYTWVPAADQPPVIAGPGISFPGLVPYDPARPPARSIKVIDPLDLAQWPKPFDPPAPAPVPSGKLVGPLSYGNVYTCNPAGWAKPNGFEHTEDGATFIKMVSRGLFGDQHYWIRRM